MLNKLVGLKNSLYFCGVSFKKGNTDTSNTKNKTMSNTEKLKALKLTMDKIDKDFGKGSVMMMNEKTQTEQGVISTGSIGLDVALGIGGLPKGRVVEIYGPES
ncbi:MAG: hypothetical protein RL736_581, partial [Pseudomonadota bacterium]